MKAKPIIFLDDGGVLSENERRGPQWRQLLSKIMPPLLGGEASAWSEANGIVIDRMLAPASWEARLARARNFPEFDYAYYLDWLTMMCALVGVTPPPDDEAVELAHEITRQVIRQVRADFPEVVATIQTLHQQGYILHTASGEPSEDLEGYLEAMGIRNYFQRLYGPDLIDTFKNGPAYYERIFADLQLPPSQALVIDDSLKAITWATSLGARGILVDRTGTYKQTEIWRVSNLSELPSMIGQIYR